MPPSTFFDALLPGALAVQKTHGIPAGFQLAQAALESAWGESGLARHGNNLFGVKADAAWTGATIDMQTREFLGNTWTVVVAHWRKYGDWAECLADHAQFFLRNRRYAPCFAQTTSEGWAGAVAAAGYATDPQYANKLIAVIRQHKLARHDSAA